MMCLLMIALFDSLFKLLVLCMLSRYVCLLFSVDCYYYQKMIKRLRYRLPRIMIYQQNERVFLFYRDKTVQI